MELAAPPFDFNLSTNVESSVDPISGLDSTTSHNVTELYDNVTSEFDEYWSTIPFAHKYWHQFNIRDIPISYHYGVAIWMTFFGILGVLGNLLVICVFFRTPSLRTPPNMLIVNLAFSDMMFSAVNGFPLLTISSINRIWPWGELCCQLYGFAGGIFGEMSIITLAFVAMDRYVAISQPLLVAQRLSKKKTAGKIVLIWMWSALWSAPPLAGWGGTYKPDGFQTSCSYDYLTQDLNNASFIIGMYTGAFVVPVGVIVYCYVGIVRSVYAHHSEMMRTAQSLGATVSKADQERRAEVQTAKVAAITIGSFMVSWTPYATIAAVAMILPHDRQFVTPYMSEIPVMFAKASAAYNPVIYALSHPKFRAQIHKTMPWLLCCCPPPPGKPSYDSSRTRSRTTSHTDNTESARSSRLELSSMPSVDTLHTGDDAGANPVAGQPTVQEAQ